MSWDWLYGRSPRELCPRCGWPLPIRLQIAWVEAQRTVWGPAPRDCGCPNAAWPSGTQTFQPYHPPEPTLGPVSTRAPQERRC